MLGFTFGSDSRRKKQSIQSIRLQFEMLGYPLDHLSDEEIRRGACRFATLCRDGNERQGSISQFVYPPRPSESSASFL
jgi:hypothetical protein